MRLRRLIATLQSTALYHGVGNDPKKPDTLFNPGIVKWQGKKDGLGAVAAWKKLLETNPAYPDKEAVLEPMAQAQQR